MSSPERRKPTTKREITEAEFLDKVRELMQHHAQGIERLKDQLRDIDWHRSNGKRVTFYEVELPDGRVSLQYKPVEKGSIGFKGAS